VSARGDLAQAARVAQVARAARARVSKRLLAGAFLLFAASAAALLPTPAAAAQPGRHAIASAHPAATAAGLEVLAAGGNAFDAAVAVSAALAVVEPYSSGIGGGGFYLLHRAADGRQTFLDARERAPLTAHRDLYLDERGEVIPRASIDGPLAAGIPGIPAALAHLARDYGALPLARSLAPAIELARDGFEVESYYGRMAGFRKQALNASPEAARIFLLDGEPPPPGHRILQPELAQTLERIAAQGADGFYRGELAELLVDGVRAAGGIWTLRDLAEYRVIEREPIRASYRGMRLVSAPPPSSGGIAMAQMLNILARFELPAASAEQRVHLIVEAMRRAYRDRALYLGDSDFVAVPVERLTHPLYAAGLAAGIRADRATPSELLPGVAKPPEGSDTTHFSILDAAGNRVSATLSVNYPFGAGFVPPGTGVLLNDEMDDFSAKPGVPNAYGLVGGEANAIEPGKRMLSSMSPSFLEMGDRLAIVGTPGGSRIITMVMLAALAFHEGASAEQMVSLPRFHHQFLPDHLQYEAEAFDEDMRLALQWMGHELQLRERGYGNMQAVVWDRGSGAVEAAADPRGIGDAQVQPVE